MLCLWKDVTISAVTSYAQIFGIPLSLYSLSEHPPICRFHFLWSCVHHHFPCFPCYSHCWKLIYERLIRLPGTDKREYSFRFQAKNRLPTKYYVIYFRVDKECFLTSTPSLEEQESSGLMEKQMTLVVRKWFHFNGRKVRNVHVRSQKNVIHIQVSYYTFTDLKIVLPCEMLSLESFDSFVRSMTVGCAYK